MKGTCRLEALLVADLVPDVRLVQGWQPAVHRVVGFAEPLETQFKKKSDFLYI
jgi:hypothetical protein